MGFTPKKTTVASRLKRIPRLPKVSSILFTVSSSSSLFSLPKQQHREESEQEAEENVIKTLFDYIKKAFFVVKSERERSDEEEEWSEEDFLNRWNEGFAGRCSKGVGSPFIANNKH
jgi:hypothetical protein